MERRAFISYYAFDQTGAPVSLEYVKTTHCTEKCTWFSDTVLPSIHGQWLEQTSTLSHQAYVYDAAGRLTQVQSTPAGKGCTTRIYAYDEDTNRTSATTREPNAKGECQSEGGAVEKHSYDQADRLTDAGVAYNGFGDITALPAADAGGAELTSSFYVDNQLSSQTQNGQSVGQNLDPAGRTRETLYTGKRAEALISHYSGPGPYPAWSANTGGETTRQITGLGGALAAVQTGSEAPVLQLQNLHGDIIATAYSAESATGLAGSADTSEYGVPSTNLPPKYSWLGAIGLPTELPSGVIDMGARSYVPELGRFLQPDPIPGGSADAYAYTFGDPINSSDPSGQSTGIPPLWAIQAGAQVAEQAVARRAAEEAAARAEAERKLAEMQAAEAAFIATYMSGGGGGEGVEEEEWYEEEGEYEYAAYHSRQLEREMSFGPGVGVAVVDNGEGRVEDAVVKSGEGQGQSKGEPAPQEQCSGGREGQGMLEVSSNSKHREYVHGPQCPKRAPGYYRNRPHRGGGGHKYKNVCVGVTGAVGGLAGTVIGGVVGEGVGSAPGGLVGTAAGTVAGEVFCQ